MHFLAAWLFPVAPVETAILGSVLLVIVAGVPLVLAAVRLPRRMDVHPVLHDELSDAQRRWFDDIEARLRVEGYHEALTFSVPNLPSQNLNRAWLSDSFPAMAMATVAAHANQDAVTSASYVEYVTEFSDGTGVTTRQAAQEDLFDPLPGSRIHVHRYVKDPVELLRRHEEHCRSAVGRKEPVHHGRDDFATVLGSFHERWVAHQHARGLLHPVDDETFRPTVKLAIRGLWSFFDPFEEGVDLLRLLAVLLGGIALPMLLNLALLDSRVPVTAFVERSVDLGPAAALALAMAPVMWLAGAIVGWAIPNNTFVWPALCAWVGSRLVLGEAGGDTLATAIWLIALAGVPVAATKASAWRWRRKRLL